MADINYFNPEGINPRARSSQDFVGPLGGMLYQQDRARYQQQAGLQDALNFGKAKEWFSPEGQQERQSELLKNTATNRAEISTVGDRKQGEVDKLSLENQYNRGTLHARVGEKLTAAAKKEHELGIQKLQDGMTTSALMLHAMGEYGPAGAAQMTEKLKSMGMDVDNDPVVKHILSAKDPEEAQQRIQEVHHALSMAQASYRQAAMHEQSATTRTLIDANAKVDAAGMRQPAEKLYDRAFGIYRRQIGEEHPDWSPAKKDAEAMREVHRRTYGESKLDTAEGKDDAAMAKELENRLTMIRPGTELYKRTEKALSDVRTRMGQPPKPGAGAAGTATNPIKLN